MREKEETRRKAFCHGYTVGYAEAYFAYQYPHETAERRTYIRTAGITMPAPNSASAAAAWTRNSHKDPLGNVAFPCNARTSEQP